MLGTQYTKYTNILTYLVIAIGRSYIFKDTRSLQIVSLLYSNSYNIIGVNLLGNHSTYYYYIIDYSIPIYLAYQEIHHSISYKVPLYTIYSNYSKVTLPILPIYFLNSSSLSFLHSSLAYYLTSSFVIGNWYYILPFNSLQIFLIGFKLKEFAGHSIISRPFYSIKKENRDLTAVFGGFCRRFQRLHCQNSPPP